MNNANWLHGWLPKIIHQTHSDSQLPCHYKQNISRIQNLCPKWEYRFYDDQDIYRYIAGHFPKILDYYNRIDKVYGAARADFFRYLLLYNEGGVYLDLKNTITRSLDDVIPSRSNYLLSHWENGPGEKYEGYGLFSQLPEKGSFWPERGEFQQWFIVSSPGHPFLRRTIEQVFENIDQYCPFKGEVGRIGVLKLTGPIAYTQAILSLMDTVEHSIIDAEKDLGFCYSFLPDIKSHETCFRYKHYSLQKRPIIAPQGIIRVCCVFKSPIAYLMVRVKRIKKSIAKRANDLIPKAKSIIADQIITPGRLKELKKKGAVCRKWTTGK